MLINNALHNLLLNLPNGCDVATFCYIKNWYLEPYFLLAFTLISQTIALRHGFKTLKLLNDHVCEEKHGAGLKGNLKHSLKDSPKDSLNDSLKCSLKESLKDSLKAV